METCFSMELEVEGQGNRGEREATTGLQSQSSISQVSCHLYSHTGATTTTSENTKKRGPRNSDQDGANGHGLLVSRCLSP